MNIKIPKHIAIIMDGNGRWAAAKNLPRAKGHEEGAASVQAVINAAKKFGVKYLTLYAFSNENWARPKFEINALMSLLDKTLDKFAKEDNGDIRIIFSGRKTKLPKKILNKLEETVAKTAANKKLTVNLALNYGSRQEITDAVNKILQSGKKKISERDIQSNLYNNIPDPDLIIRTSGEERLSNFLLWQAAYSEFYFTPALWPDFREKEFAAALQEYSKRDRRYGARKD
ncbi:MAG: di-trans,poly-cis-decaprenylcistransferase [Elusimicrobiota bacterium]|nr:di-trans,poly-cis-decaprenylcistransferase [Elusimicrobiota bacterium]